MTSMPTLQNLQGGGKRLLADALAGVEAAPGDASVVALLDSAYAAARAHVIGVTGPPGVGKSSLINVLIRRWRQTGSTVGVVAVDPSSRMTGGALLGDRTRMETDPADQGVFVRSLAARGRLGGLADLAFPAIVLMRALFDVVLVESVGVGQSEAEIGTLADTIVLCVQPGSGDSLQFMKAGIMEIPDVAVVTKADVGKAAERTLAELQGALSLSSGSEAIRVLAASAQSGAGVTELVEALSARYAGLAQTGQLATIRHRHAAAWLGNTIRIEFGRQGLVAVGGDLQLPAGTGPFAHEQALIQRLHVSRH